jgi:hypothetical protein
MPKRKNPNLPKRAMTAYMLFSQEKRAQIKSKNPDVSFGQVGKLLGEAWATVPEAEKKKFNELAAKDKIRYQKEMASYKEEHPESSDEDEIARKKKKKKKDPDAPKKPCSAFFHFSKRIRPKVKEDNPQANFGQLGKIIGEQWIKLGPEERKEFEALAAADKVRYAREVKEYQERQQDTSSDSNSDLDSDSGSDLGSDSSSSSDVSDSD